ncbi:MAG: HipA N-terminal domain-containing protein [Prevotellaceae bacterium]|nr:HipA N-terminal domain-containing protein [Prevotellaceae bacterium]
MRQAKVFYKDKPAGVLTEEDGGYTFRYEADYLARPKAEPVSLTLPLRAKSYAMIEASFLSDNLKQAYIDLLAERLAMLQHQA